MLTTPTITRYTDTPPTLEEAQAVVGGWVEMMTLPNGDQLLVNEEGGVYGLPVNPEASVLAGTFIVGPVALLQGKGRWTDDDDEEDDDEIVVFDLGGR